MSERVTLKIAEVAARTGLSRTYLFQQIKDGRLKSFRVGKHRMVHVDDEAAFIAAHRAEQQAA